MRPDIEPKITAIKLVDDAMIGSNPKKIMMGNRTLPKAIPIIPPKNPMSRHKKESKK